jgi:enoyl-[acyl-carrier protein] reductase I
MLKIDLTGRRALVAGVADDQGYGFAIAKALAEAGATVTVGTWPPALTIFMNLLERGKIDESRRLSSGGLLTFEKIYPLDAAFDTHDQMPEDIRSNKRYKDVGDCSIEGLARRLADDFGEKPLDIVVHSLANGPEVKKPLLETSRSGYLAAVSVSAYSLVALIQRLGPLMRPGGAALSLTYMASERVIPGYGGGMSSAKAALESDTRTLAFEAGRKFGIRLNTISAGPLASESSSVWWTTCHRTRRSPSPCQRWRSATPPHSSARRWRVESPAPRFTSTKATTRWGWPWTQRRPTPMSPRGSTGP